VIEISWYPFRHVERNVLMISLQNRHVAAQQNVEIAAAF